MSTKSVSERTMRSGNHAGVYVDLDSLLDTRISTLANMKEEYALEALNNGYFSRQIDEFPHVPHTVFKKAYEKRDVSTLAGATFTNAFVLLKAIIKGTFEASITNANVGPLLITVNVHPYDLDEEEMAEISMAVSHRINAMADVQVVKYNDAYLTPSYCKENFEIMIRYDYEPWLKQQMDSKSFESHQMPSVSVVAPAIYQKMPTEAEMDELKENNIHPFTAAETTMAPFFGLKLVDVDVFCISKEVIDAFKKELSAEPDKFEDVTGKRDDGIKPEGVSPSEPGVVVQDSSDSEFDLL